MHRVVSKHSKLVMLAVLLLIVAAPALAMNKMREVVRSSTHGHIPAEGAQFDKLVQCYENFDYCETNEECCSDYCDGAHSGLFPALGACRNKPTSGTLKAP